jgi:hypothetical protein
LAFLLIALIIGLIPAGIAQSKGESFIGWWIYGSLLFIVALPHALLMKGDRHVVEARAVESGDSKKCPDCAEIVKAEAAKCRFCGHLFANDQQAARGG